MLMESWVLFRVEAVEVRAWAKETQRKVFDLNENGVRCMLMKSVSTGF